MEITNTEQLIAYLAEKEIYFKSLEQLDGGSANFVWRIINESRDSVIIKHAEPCVAASKQIPLSVDRMDFENFALSTLAEHTIQNVPVRLPEVYVYDCERQITMMEDGGPHTLKAAYKDPCLDIPTMGFYLGIWLASLHKATRFTGIGNNETAKRIYRFSYNNLAGVLEKYGLDPTLGDLVNEQFGSLLQTDDECVCHGDFWPGNVLVIGEQMTVVDWELVRRGCGATDVGQFAAEAYLLDRFLGRRLLPAFLAGYRGDEKVDERFAQRVAVHMGVHLTFWPTRVAWGTAEETVECVKAGCDLLQSATGEPKGWVKSGLLKELL